MAATVYILCALTSLACAFMLWRGFTQSRARFLLWSSLCFIALATNNILLFLDRVVLPDVQGFWGTSFQNWRSAVALVGIWDAE
jgi:hypothetical protein